MTIIDSIALKKCLNCSLFSLISLSAIVLNTPSLAAPKINVFISNELTHSSNLETPTDVDSERNALALAFNAQYQNLDYNGGYIWDVGISNQAGSLDDDEQQYLMLSLSFLSSLNDNWLLRNSVSLSQLDNSILPSNSNKRIAFNNTMGSLALDNSGFDYSFNVQQQTHNDLVSDQYIVSIPVFQVQYYFPHLKQQAYWSLSGGISAHNYSEQNNVNREDYRSLTLSADYINAHMLGFNSNLKLVWQQDTYESQASSNQSRFQGRRHIQQLTNSNSQIDQLISIETRLLKPLNKSTNLEIKWLWGSFSSNNSDRSTDFYKVSSAIHWVF